MVINKIKYFPKELNFITPFKTSTNIYKKRNILFIKIYDELKNSGIGECAPLPELGTETYEFAQEKLNILCKSLANFTFDENNIDDINNLLLQLDDSPSLRFAFDQAVQNLIIQRTAKSIIRISNRESKNQINVNAVVGFGEQNEIVKKIDSLLYKGYKTIKLKCGRANFKNDLNLISEIRKIFLNELNLRLDINGNWNFKDANRYINELEDFNLEYIEQPVADINELLELSILSKVNIAADESLHSFDNAIYLLNKGLKYLVLKPTVVGGILKTIQILNEAEQYKANVIISSSFESAIGKSILVYLASLANHHYAHGLDVENLFVSNICDDPYPVSKGLICFDVNHFPTTFNFYD